MQQMTSNHHKNATSSLETQRILAQNITFVSDIIHRCLVQTWNAAAESVWVFSNQVIIDAVFERTKHDDWPSIFHYHINTWQSCYHFHDLNSIQCNTADYRQHYWSPRLARSLLFFVFDSVCPSVRLSRSFKLLLLFCFLMELSHFLAISYPRGTPHLTLFLHF